MKEEFFIGDIGLRLYWKKKGVLLMGKVKTRNIGQSRRKQTKSGKWQAEPQMLISDSNFWKTHLKNIL